MKRRTLVFASASLVLIAFLCYLGSMDHHRTNLKYNLWKIGLVKYETGKPLKYINVDVDFREYLKGKSKEEIKKWFPELVEPMRGNGNQLYFTNEVMRMDFLWIGKSNWGIEFKDDKVAEFHLIKG